MAIQKVDSFAPAMVSIFLYGSLAVTCFYFASKFWDFQEKKLRSGLYVAPKFTFFIVLGISALLDLPTFITCSAMGGPEQCEWNDVWYAVCWSCHLLATCGQQFAVITPSILWSDIIQHKDGNFWNSASQLDGVKIFFRISWVIYCCVIIMTIFGVILFSNPSDEDAYTAHTTVGALSNLLDPIMLVTTASGCLYSGIRLQRHVVKVGFGTATQVRFLAQLNFLMLFITCSYILRAIMVMSLYGPMPDAYKNLFNPVGSYPLWLPLTQWLPFVFCSYCLVYNMRFKGGGADQKDSLRLNEGIDMKTIRAFTDSNPRPTDPQERSLSTDTDATYTEETHSPFDHRGSRGASSVDITHDRSLSYLMRQNSITGQTTSPLSAHLQQHQQRDLFRNSEAPNRYVNIFCICVYCVQFICCILVLHRSHIWYYPVSCA